MDGQLCCVLIMLSLATEDGSTAGLYYARMEEYHDEPMRLPGSSHWNNVAERPSRESISEIIGEGEAESREVVAEETINVQALVTECRMLIELSGVMTDMFDSYSNVAVTTFESEYCSLRRYILMITLSYLPVVRSHFRFT